MMNLFRKIIHFSVQKYFFFDIFKSVWVYMAAIKKNI